MLRDLCEGGGRCGSAPTPPPNKAQDANTITKTNKQTIIATTNSGSLRLKEG